MRVITGEARGKKLIAPAGLNVRPTSDMVKEAVFSIIQFDVAAANVLDLFSGTGQLGIEALSRGAKSCVFVDQSSESIAVTRKNVELCGFLSRASILNMSAEAYLSSARKGINIALLDPPYGKGLIMLILPKLERILTSRAKVICEHESTLCLPDTVGGLKTVKRYRYGKIALTLLKPIDNDGE